MRVYLKEWMHFKGMNIDDIIIKSDLKLNRDVVANVMKEGEVNSLPYLTGIARALDITPDMLRFCQTPGDVLTYKWHLKLYPNMSDRPGITEKDIWLDKKVIQTNNSIYAARLQQWLINHDIINDVYVIHDYNGISTFYIEYSSLDSLSLKTQIMIRLNIFRNRTKNTYPTKKKNKCSSIYSIDMQGLDRDGDVAKMYKL